MTMLDRSSILTAMNKLSTDKRVRILACLAEGNSVRATCRLTGAAKGTVLKLLADIGAACKAHHDATVRGLRVQRAQADEVWAFLGAKDKNVPESKRGQPDFGSAWTWTCIDARYLGMWAARCGREAAQHDLEQERLAAQAAGRRGKA